MLLSFYKYQGTGNDFVIIDNRNLIISKNDTKLVKRLCDRKFGIGADGLMLLELPDGEGDDFKMIYFNADGNESTMCGNGGRCLVAFAAYLGIFKKNTFFTAIDGRHYAEINGDIVRLQMQDVLDIQKFDSHYFIDTGSPHHVLEVNEIHQYDVKGEGRKIRYGAPYYEQGSNVNFVQLKEDNSFDVRTYERGVEDETLSCGTGVTAVALAMYEKGIADNTSVKINTPGGVLEVSFEKNGSGYKNIFLKGPATLVFKGEIEC